MQKLITGLAFVLACSLNASLARAQDSQSSSPLSEQTYLSFQVDQMVRVRTRAVPVYPERLRAAHVEGAVMVQFAVDERGAAQMSTFKVLKATNEAFVESVKHAVSAMSFHPAEAQGRKVKQLVQQEFKFATRN